MQGQLTQRRAQTGALSGGGIIQLPEGVFGTMPDWAPDDGHLVFAVDDAQNARHLVGSSLAWMRRDGDGFAGFEFIAEAVNELESYANPMFSPDSRFIGYSRGDFESEGDFTSEIFVSPAQANAPSHLLERANRVVGRQTGVTRLMNSMPTWAPTGEASLAWIAFTSVRDYGVVLHPDSELGTGQKQLWVAAVDLEKIGLEDASFPAFRLPAQDLDENNHRPFWAVDVLPPDWTPPEVR
jgi:hypothetical protein